MPSRPTATSNQGPDGHAMRVDRVLLLLGVSILAGVLTAGLALPVIGGMGIAVRDGVQTFDDLPSELQRPPLPQRSVIYAADGETVLGSFYYENRQSVPLSEVAPVMQKAIVAIEDSRFYEHHGFDLRGTMRALVSTSSGTVQGGSTITQQYVKNVLIEEAKGKDDAKGIEAAREQTVGRKIRELRYSLALEEKLSKDEILERYLNTVLFGAGAYGIDAAAQRYFSKPASELTLPEAALLAGAVQNPSRYDPTRNPNKSKERRNVVLNRMAELGVITAGEAEAAKASPLEVRVSDIPNGCATSTAPFFCDYVVKEIQSNPIFGATKGERTKLLLRGGLTIYTTLDLKMQASAQSAVDNYVPRDPDKNSGVASAIAMLEPGTGHIKAMAIDRDFGKGPSATEQNYAADYTHGTSKGFQAGSTFKVFVLAAALQQGLPVSHRIHSPPQAHFERGEFTDCNGAPQSDWHPRNAEAREGGDFSLVNATAASVNTYFAKLELEIGICPAVELAESMGIKRADGTPVLQYPSFVLGSNEVSPVNVAEAYATFAARGLHCSPIVITRMESTVDGVTKELKVPDAGCAQVIEPEVADAVNWVLTQVIDGPLSGRTGRGLSLGRPAAGKTGTTNDSMAAWFAGYTPDLAAAVWVGNPKGSTAQYWMRNITIGDRRYGQVYGATIPGPIWKTAMLGALEGSEAKNFTTPDRKVLYGSGVSIPDVAGLMPEEAAARLAEFDLQAQVGDTLVDSEQPAGSVAWTDPGIGERVYPGQTVTLYLSRGFVTPPSPTPDETPPGGDETTPPIIPPPSTLPTVPTPPPDTFGRR